MYSPSLGRFISQDPKGYIDGMNLYAYVKNNPLRYLDAFGTTAIDNSYRPSTFDRIISGLGDGLSKLWDRRDDISTNIVTASQGAVQGAQNMLVNAPTYAKVPLYLATSFTLAATAVPVVEVAVTTVITNPNTVNDFVKGFDAKSPNIFNPAHSLGYGSRKMIEFMGNN